MTDEQMKEVRREFTMLGVLVIVAVTLAALVLLVAVDDVCAQTMQTPGCETNADCYAEVDHLDIRECDTSRGVCVAHGWPKIEAFDNIVEMDRGARQPERWRPMIGALGGTLTGVLVAYLIYLTMSLDHAHRRIDELDDRLRDHGIFS